MKNKLAKLMGVVLTAMTVVSLFAFAVPASAAITPQTWTKQALPGATNLVMPNNVLASGLLTQAADGSLYMYAQTGTIAVPVNSILKSTNGGRAWTAKGAAGVVTSLVALGTNVYYTTATQLFRSQDSGATYINIANVIGGGTFTSMDVATFSGRNIIILGTTNNVYFVDEADPFFNLVALGTPDFAGAVGGSVVAVKAAPSFATDRGVAAISSNGKVSFDVMGGAWGGIIFTAPVVSGGTVTAASISFTSDWNSTTLPNFYFGISGGTAPGVYAFRGGVNSASSTIQLYAASSTSTANVSSLAVSGTYGAATIYAGIVNDSTHPVQLVWSTNSGVSWTSPTKLQSLTFGKSVYVVLDKSFAAATPNNTVYVLVGGTGLVANDQTGFYYSVDKGVTFNQISLINNTISTINDLAASSGTTFISTSFAGTDPASAIPAGSVIFNSGSMVNTIAAAAADSITITSGAAANANPLTSNVIFGYNSGSMPTFTPGPGVTWIPATNTIVFTAPGQTITIAATQGNSTFVLTGYVATVIGSIASTGTALVTGSDPNYGVTESGPTAAGVSSALFNNSTVTLVPNPGANVTVVFSPAGGTYNAGTGVITFSAANQTATVTNNTGAPLTFTNANFTFTSGTSSTVVPTFRFPNTSNITLSLPTYSVGTVALVAGSATVTGTGTTFTAAMVGGTLTVGANTYSIVGFTSATVLTIDPVAVATATLAAYTIALPSTIYSAGTITLTVGSDVVTGTGTAFTAAMIGQTLTVGGLSYTIDGFTSATILSLDDPATVAATNAAYTIAFLPGTGAFVLGIPVAAIAGTSADSIWRWDGTNFERVFVGLKTLLPTTAPAGTTTSWPTTTPAIGTATMVRVSSTYATDKTVFYAAVGGIYLSYSTDAGQTWKTQTSAIGSSNGTIDQINSLLVVDGNTQYVGSNMSVVGQTSRIIKSTTNGAGNILSPAWSEVILKTVAGATLTGAVTDIEVASNGDLVAAVTDTLTYVFKSTDAGATWKGLADPNASSSDATLPSSVNGVRGAFVNPAADYATTGNIFVTLFAGGVYRYSALNTVSGAYGVAVSGWLRVDGANYNANGAVLIGAGQVVAAGGPGSVAEGSGMVYATDATAGQGVSRIRGLSTQAEALLAPGITFYGLWASSSVVGNVQLWTIDNAGKALWTYVDTLNVAGGAVVATATGVNNATVSFPALANATDYVVLVSLNKINSLYGATGALATSDADITVTYAAGALTATVKGLVSGTTYYVSVWAIAPVSSFIFGGATAPASFTTPLDYPRTPTDPLVPTLGATNIPLSPNFAWNTVPFATSYTLQITAASDVAFASPIFNSATIPVVTGPSATFTYLGTLSTGTSYLWRVKANGTTGSDWVYGNFSTIAATTPAVIVTQIPAQPAPTIIITQQPAVTITIPPAQAAPVITVTSPSYTLVTPTPETPTYIWIIVGVGALLTLAVIILIIRTRRVV
jgi:hypothetical protein